jgi:hypothetical protein
VRLIVPSHPHHARPPVPSLPNPTQYAFPYPPARHNPVPVSLRPVPTAALLSHTHLSLDQPAMAPRTTRTTPRIIENTMNDSLFGFLPLPDAGGEGAYEDSVSKVFGTSRSARRRRSQLDF